MGVGYERDIVLAVQAGVDMFDCVLPTRNARNANVFTRTGRMHLTNAKFREDTRVIEEGCDCMACAGPSGTGDWGLRTVPGARSPQSSSPSPDSHGFSRAYLRHLFMAGEMLYSTLATMHNLFVYLDRMRAIRQAILDGDLPGYLALLRSMNERAK
jgi:queuine tRNA-ribosyltransferase